MKSWKKALALVLALAMVIPGVYLGGSKVQEVKAEVTAADGSYKILTADEVEKLSEDSNGVPVCDGYLFAGWFNDADCTIKNAAKKGETGTHAKFVPAGVLNVKAQSTLADRGDGDIIRFVSSVDTLNYSQVGFEVTYNVGVDKDDDEEDVKDGFVTKTNISDTVFKRIECENNNIEYAFSPKVVDFKSDYFITATLDINQSPFNEYEIETSTGCLVRAFWDTLDGTRVRGASRYVSIDDCRDTETINLTFTAKDVAEGPLYVTSSQVSDKVKIGTANVVKVDGETVHVRVNVEGKAYLPSATKFSFATQESGPEVGSAIYRNYETVYTGKDTEDITWYEVYGDVREYTIATSADLYGLATLAENGNHAFEGATIYLVLDIKVNDVTVENWQNNTPIPWNLSIGNGIYVNGEAHNREFAGTFDGQGHTIYGLYAKRSSASNVALFGCLSKDASIKNLTIEDSYIEGNAATSAIAGQGGKSIENVHVGTRVTLKGGNMCGGIVGKLTMDTAIIDCDVKATIEGTTNAGGLAGRVCTGSAHKEDSKATTGNVTIENCEFTGAVKGTTGVGGLIGGVETTATVTDSNVAGTIEGTTGIGGVIGSVTGTSADVSKCNFDGVIVGTDKLGGIIGSVETTATVTNCDVAGEIGNETSQYVGGVIGAVTNPDENKVEVSTCKFSGNVTGTTRIGGMIGSIDTTKGIVAVSDCYTAEDANILVTALSAGGGGGIIGWITATTGAPVKVDYCLNEGTIENGKEGSKTTDRCRIGGICGVVGGSGKAEFNNCLNVGDIITHITNYSNGDNQAGSFGGFFSNATPAANTDITVNNSYGIRIAVKGDGNSGNYAIVGNYGNKVSVSPSSLVDKSDLTGHEAKENESVKALFEGNDMWVTRTDSTPMLKSFINN